MKKLLLSLILLLSIPVTHAMAPAAAAAEEKKKEEQEELAERLLLPFNGDPNGVDEYGNNALHKALSPLHRIYNSPSRLNMHTDIKALVKAGTRCNHENRDGNSPLDYAKNAAIMYSFQPKAEYSRISDAMKKSLQEAQTARQLTKEILATNGLPVDTLTQLVCEYANLKSRRKEIQYVNKHRRQSGYDLEREERAVKLYRIQQKIATTMPSTRKMILAVMALNSLSYYFTNHFTPGEYVACSVLEQKTLCSILRWPLNG